MFRFRIQKKLFSSSLCWGNLDCLYPKAPTSGPNSGKSGLSASAAANAAIDAAMFGGDGAGKIEGYDTEEKEVAPFDFNDCSK